MVSQPGFPLVVKPAPGSSALGVSIVSDQADFARAMVSCFTYGATALISQFVSDTELAVSVVSTEEGPVALPIVEIVTDRLYDFDARYSSGRTQYFTLAGLSPQALASATSSALPTRDTLGLQHIWPTDLILSANASPSSLR